MGGGSRGSDISSWFQNRAGRRREVTESLSRLGNLQTRLAQAAGGAASGPAGGGDDTAESLLQQGEALLVELAGVENGMAQLEQTQQTEQAALNAESARLKRASEVRAQQQAAAKAQNAAESRQRWAGRRQKVERLAIAVFLVAALIFWYRC